MSSQTKIVRETRDGQIAIPAEFRQELGLGEESVLLVTLDNGELRIRPVPGADVADGADWYRQLYDYFAPVREEILAVGYSEEEVKADIDAAVRDVRNERAKRGECN